MGTITFDWFDDDSGEVNCDIGDYTPESQLLYNWLNDKNKSRWHIDNETINIENKEELN
jgi:hypothetical protein